MEAMTAIKGDITRADVDAIVNAANEMLLPGGGVCGAIFRAAGPGLEAACRAVAPCPTGQARLTPGFALKARHIIHAVGPVWHGGTAGEDAALVSCYRAIWAVAQDHKLHSVALPAISTGIFGFPRERAARIAVQTSSEAVSLSPRMRALFVCFDDDTLTAYREALATVRGH